ncbi:MAG TPA: Rnase Y domain-containing protein, partial [Candidatus Limnocylindria bacterium]|nr:Rnase Y domain-containing protein [Candidatus Limnocylindria bacterium]
MPDTFVVGLIVFIVAVPIGFGAALLVRRQFALNSETNARANADRLLAEARTKQKDIILEAKDEALKVAKAAENENRERRAELQRYESRLDKKDEQLDAQTAELAAKERKLAEKEAAVEAERAKIEQLHEEQRAELSRVAALSQDEARSLLLERVEEEMRDITNRKVREYEI